MKKTALIASALLPLSLAVQTASADALQDRVNQLEKELAELKAAVKEQQVEKEKPGVTIKKGTTFQYGGYIKVDAMWSDYDAGDRASASIGDEIYVPSTVPVGGENGSARFDSHAKTTRLWFKTATQTKHGVVRSHIETDFLTAGGDERISNSAGNRLRHAYLAWDYKPGSSVLAGQTWSTFFNVGALPEAIDFIGPTAGTIFNRQNQIRWTTKLGAGSLMLAAENPSTSIIDGNNKVDDNSMPDIVARYNATSGDLSWSVAGVVREIALDDGTVDESEMGFGLSIAGKWSFGRDNLKFMVNHGTLGRYIALNAFRDAAIEADGSLDLATQTGGFVAYQHWWNPKLRSTVAYAMATSDNPDGVALGNNESVSNAYINLIYSPVPNLSFGGELLRGERETEAGEDGELTRLQFMAKWVF
jgi:hypothetical protein